MKEQEDEMRSYAIMKMMPQAPAPMGLYEFINGPRHDVRFLGFIQNENDLEKLVTSMFKRGFIVYNIFQVKSSTEVALFI